MIAINLSFAGSWHRAVFVTFWQNS